MKGWAVPAWLRLIRVFQRVDHASQEQLRAWDISVAQFDVIGHVGAAEGMTQQALADRLLVSKGNICQLLDKLEHARLIERRGARTGGPIGSISPTPATRSFARSCRRMRR